ncbi:hypothetical protein [Ramlibacter sp.]|uniref:hypothetical protein n=1 Tax=Ramlibacter sp. TaxID=1917967 RepID=UPI0035B1C02B
MQAHEADRTSVRKLLDAAQRNLADAQIAELSADNRFDAAYKCIVQCAMLGLWGHGFRTATSQPGHHQTAIQCLSLTMAVPQATVIVLAAAAQCHRLCGRPRAAGRAQFVPGGSRQAAGAHAGLVEAPAT